MISTCPEIINLKRISGRRIRYSYISNYPNDSQGTFSYNLRCEFEEVFTCVIYPVPSKGLSKVSSE